MGINRYDLVIDFEFHLGKAEQVSEKSPLMLS